METRGKRGKRREYRLSVALAVYRLIGWLKGTSPGRRTSQQTILGITWKRFEGKPEVRRMIRNRETGATSRDQRWCFVGSLARRRDAPTSNSTGHLNRERNEHRGMMDHICSTFFHFSPSPSPSQLVDAAFATVVPCKLLIGSGSVSSSKLERKPLEPGNY